MTRQEILDAVTVCCSSATNSCDGCPIRNTPGCTERLRYELRKALARVPENEAETDTAKADQGEPHMSYDERKAAYRDAIDRWGSYSQIWMAVEEMSEPTNALCKLRRDRCSVHDVAEEIADVTIMMEQLRMIFDINDEVSGIMDKKIRRLNRRITLSKEGDNDG